MANNKNNNDKNYRHDAWALMVVTLLGICAVELGVLVSKLTNGFHFIWQ
jgi:hypothetical protein